MASVHPPHDPSNVTRDPVKIPRWLYALAGLAITMPVACESSSSGGSCMDISGSWTTTSSCQGAPASCVITQTGCIATANCDTGSYQIQVGGSSLSWTADGARCSGTLANSGFTSTCTANGSSCEVDGSCSNGACGDVPMSFGSGGASNSGGSSSSGGRIGSGGAVGSGSVTGTGGYVIGTGGYVGAGGYVGLGGYIATGGFVATGGYVATGGSGGGSAACQAITAKLLNCGILSSGAPTCVPGPTTDCEAGCVGQATCPAFQSFVCNGPTTDVLSNCMLSCVNPEFTCGDGTTVPQSWVCDGYPDCSTGADEVGCVMFQCGNGQTVPPNWVCDGYDDCGNGADEVGCPSTTFLCTNGSTVPQTYRCDGFNDCGDGSDELGCPTYACVP